MIPNLFVSSDKKAKFSTQRDLNLSILITLSCFARFYSAT